MSDIEDDPAIVAAERRNRQNIRTRNAEGAHPHDAVRDGVRSAPAPLHKRISLSGWALAGVISLCMWGIIIYLAMKLL